MIFLTEMSTAHRELVLSACLALALWWFVIASRGVHHIWLRTVSPVVAY